MNDDFDIDIIKLIDKEIAKLSLTDKYCYALGADLNKLEGEIQSIELYEIEKSEDVYLFWIQIQRRIKLKSLLG